MPSMKLIVFDNTGKIKEKTSYHMEKLPPNEDRDNHHILMAGIDFPIELFDEQLDRFYEVDLSTLTLKLSPLVDVELRCGCGTGRPGKEQKKKDLLSKYKTLEERPKLRGER